MLTIILSGQYTWEALLSVSGPTHLPSFAGLLSLELAASLTTTLLPTHGAQIGPASSCEGLKWCVSGQISDSTKEQRGRGRIRNNGKETVKAKLSSRAVMKEQGLGDMCLHKGRTTQ